MLKKTTAPKSRFLRSKLALAIAAQMLFSGNVGAAPAGGEVVGGAGNIEQQGADTTIIQNTERLAIDWQSFDVGKNERVEFVQPGQTAVALNRILGNKGSEILGRIDANGHVILVNPRGVVFGESATVNAGGLIASGLQINPDDFMNGDLAFKRIEGTDGAVINSGVLNAASGGNIALIGARVKNRGLISAKLGTVILASGKEAVLTFDESGLLGVRVDEALLQDELGNAAAVSNSGSILAENGRVLLSASVTRDAFSQAVNWGEKRQARSVVYNEDGSFDLGGGGDLENSGLIDVSGINGAGDVVALAENVTHTGVIHADAEQGDGGYVELSSSATTIIEHGGAITANADRGGDIKLLGKNVGLFDQSSVEAIGKSGGGEVLVGGDREGLNFRIPNADFTYIGEHTAVNVSASHSGDGGTAIFFAEDTARIYGSISAKGGNIGGAGGFVETSGKKGFEIINSPDLSAPNGAAGHWLIDPYNITIEANISDGISLQNPFVSNGNSAILNVTTLESALNAAGGAVVTVQTGSGGSADQGNIIVSSEINLTSNVRSTLNLIAHNNITINANITSVFNGQKSPDRKLNVNLNANTSGNQGGVSFGSNTRIETGGGDFKIAQITDDSVNADQPGAYNISLNNLTIDIDEGDFVAHASNRLTLGRNLDLDGGNLVLGAADWRFSNYRLITAADSTSSDEGNITLITGGNLALPGIQSAGDVTIRNRDVLSELTVNNLNDEDHRIQLAGELIFDLGVGSASFTNVRTASQNTSDIAFATDIRIVSGRNISLEVDNGIRLNDVKMTGDLYLDSQSNIIQRQNTSIEIDGMSTLLVNDQDVILDGPANKFVGALYISGSDGGAARDVTVASSASVLFGNPGQTISVTGDLLVDAGVDIRQNGALKVSGVTTLTAGSAIFLENAGNEFSSLRVGGAQTATLDYSGDLQLAAVENVGRFGLSVQGNLTQTAALDVDQLILNISGSTTLTQSENRIGILSGEMLSGGEIVVASPVEISDLSLTAGTTISAAEIDLSGPVQLTDEADLIFNDVANFALSGQLLGVDSLVNSVTVNGTGSDDTYFVSNTASWINLSFAINGGDGADALQGPNLDAVWSITDSDAHSLSTNEQGQLTFSGMETLSGGSQSDTFSFVDATTTDLSLVGGEGNDVADYSAVDGNITVYVGVEGGLSDVELIRGNNTGTANFNSRLSSQSDLENVWLINASNAGEVSVDNGQTMEFEGFNQLLGGDGEDQFILQADLLGGAAQVDGAGGNDIFDIEADIETELLGRDGNDIFNFMANALGRITGGEGDDNYVLTSSALISVIDGGAGVNTLEGFDSDLTWFIDSGTDEAITVSVSDGAGIPVVEQALNLTGLKGAGADDTFLFSIANSGVGVDGGEGINIADFSLIDENHTVNLGALGESGISNVTAVIGNAAQGFTSTLEIVGSSGGVWTFEAADSGAVSHGSEEIQFSQFNQFWGGDGEDSFLISVSPAGAIDGRGGDDVFSLLAPALAARLNGGDGEDTLEAYQQIDNTWVLSSTTSLLQQTANGTSIQFNGMETLLGAETYADNFVILDDLESQPTILAGDGEAIDTIDYSRLQSPGITVTLGDAGLTGFESVIGNRNQTLKGADENSRWELAIEGGSVSWGSQNTGFSGFGYWVGGDGNDVFNLRILSAESPVGIDGGGGSDELDLSALEGVINIGLGDANGDLDLANIEIISANSLFANRLTSNAVQAEWTINNVNAGTVEETGGSPIVFSGFHHLRGVQGNTFTLTSEGYLGVDTAVGSIAGGEGTSTLRIIGGDDHSWLLDGGAGNGSLWQENIQRLSFASLTNLQGGEGADEFVLNNAEAIIASLDGGAGINSLRADFQANDGLEWTVMDGAGEIVGLVGEFQQVTQLYGHAGADVFHINGATQLQLVDGGAGSDEIRLADNSHVDSIIAGAGADTVAISDSATVQQPINGGEDNDTLDLTNYATAVIWNAVEQHIGSFDYLNIENFKAPAGDDLRNTFQAPDTNNIWTISGDDSGQLETGGQVVTYEAIANLLGGSMEDLFVLTEQGSVSGEIDGGGGNNTLQGDENGNQWNLTDLDAGNLGDRVGTFKRIAHLLGGGGNDSFTIEADGVLSGVLDAGAGSDSLGSERQQQRWKLSGDAPGTIAVNDGDAFLAFLNLESFEGAGDDILLGSELDTFWTIDGEGTGSLLAGGFDLTFANFARVLGGEGADYFTIVGDGALNGPIDGGGGINALVIERDGIISVNLDPERAVPVGNVIDVQRIHNIEAVNDDANRLYGAGINAAGYNWTISGINTGTVSAEGSDEAGIVFSNFSHVFGGDTSDNFRFDTAGSLVGVDGGGDDDYLDYSASASNLEITIGNLGQGTNFTINNIEGLVGNDNGSGENAPSATLIASSGANLWTISEGDGDDPRQDGTNDGVFVQEGGLRMVFRDFGHLQGGSGDDHFVLQGQGMLTGSIVDGGGNNNRLDLSSIDAGRSLRAVMLASDATPDGSSDTLHIRGLQRITGAGTATTLVGAATDNEWMINGSDFGQVTYEEHNTVRFNNFFHVQGGEAADTFEIGPAGRLSGLLSGGVGEDAVEFNNSQAVSVWLGATATDELWWRLQTDIENVTAQGDSRNNQFRLESAEEAIWALTNADVGAVGNTSFSGFGQLRGGAGNDQFIFGANGRVSSLLDGGAGTNSVDLTGLSGPVKVSLGDREDIDLRIANIQRVDAGLASSNENLLWGLDQASTWTITAADSGNTSYGLIFTGFGNLTGGSADDFFKFSPEGTLSGKIDGGAHDAHDTADYGSITSTLTIDLTTEVLINIEELVGNSSTKLQGPNSLSLWEFAGGRNQGVVAYNGDQRLSFSGVNNVVGGNQIDIFRFSGGALITNGVNGGDGADLFEIAPGIGVKQATWLAGGAGTDSLEFVGGEGWSGTYGPNADGAPVFSFIAPAANDPSFSIGYSGMESVLMRSALDSITLNGTVEADTYRLGEASWQWGNLLPVFYRDALQSITVASEIDDTVSITGRVAVTNELRLNGGTLVLDSSEPISARHLVLTGLSAAGSIDRPINTSVEALSLSGNLADVHVIETDGLSLRELSGEKPVSLTLLNGDLNQTAVLNTAANLTFAAERGNIELEHSENVLTGLVAVEARDRATLQNAGVTQLGTVSAENFTLMSAGDIYSESVISVDEITQLVSGGEINLLAEDNDLNDVSAKAAGNIQLADGNSLVLSNIESESGNIDITTQGAQGLGLLSAAQGEVRLHSGGVMVDWNGTQTNVRAQRFFGRSVDGIGSSNDPLETEISAVDLVNERNAVALNNTGPLAIERIHNGGDINLKNSTDVTFIKESVNAFHGTEDAQYPPINDRELPNYGGSFLLNIEIGNIKTDGSIILAQPHIAAKTVTILNPHGVFLPPSPVIYAPERIKITSGRSRNRPYWGLEVVPNEIDDETKYYGDVVGAGDQLIEVESLAEIDPAIFTPVRNYVYQDVSIRLPSDQLYEDEE